MSFFEVNNLVFFLGGRDLEMLTIRELLERHAPLSFCDKGLAWGAKASDYRGEIEEALRENKTSVLIELTNDLNLSESEMIFIDHHGKRAGNDKPTSLHQVFDLLKLNQEVDWTRWHELVAANDRGYIQGMLEIGASVEEIKEVRAADRRAQGITDDEEAAAEEALNHLEIKADGKLTVAHLTHSKTAALADRLEPALGGIGFQNLIIVSPDQLNFFGSGEAIYKLKDSFSDCWYGGSLPERGYWGSNSVKFDDALKVLLEHFET